MNVYRITLTELNPADALRYLGLKNGLDDPAMAALYEKCTRALLPAIDARCVCRIFPWRDGVIEGCAYRPAGQSIREHLAGCDRVALIAATLGPGVDALIRRASLSGMAEAMMTDALASGAVEQVLDEAETLIFSSLPPSERTFRYSPGYGDLPLGGQKELLEVLDARKRIGVYVNESLLLSPLKSVTCLIGLGQNLPAASRKTCRGCTLDGKCIFRQNNTTCFREGGSNGYQNASQK